jgi:hypothetical protein
MLGSHQDPREKEQSLREQTGSRGWRNLPPTQAKLPGRTCGALSLLVLSAAGACLMLTAPAALATPGAQLWVSRYSGPGSGVDFARALGVSPDGSRVLVTGLGRGSGTGDDYATVAYDASTG